MINKTDKITAKASENEDYKGADGLIYCGSCHTAKQGRIENGKMAGRLFPRKCKCEQELFDREQAIQEENRHRFTVDKLRKDCFSDASMHLWTFENDNGNCPHTEKARFYAENFNTMQEENIGLLLWGGVGTGKSYFAGCIANFLIEKEVPVHMTNFSAVMNELMGSFEGRNEYISRLCRYPLLILDDFGMERGTEYALEQVYNVIDSRYRSKKPLIVTTNIPIRELKNPHDLAHARIYDRLIEICVPIRFEGESFRKETAKAKMDRLMQMME